MKTREEHETVVSDGDVLTRVLESLGLHVWFRYQKFREEFAAEDATIALDETPIGTFVEIEGGERAIEHMARALGRTRVRLRARLVSRAVPAAARTARADRRRHDVRRRMVPALVLTAGLATRLRPLSLVRAKAALPVAGTPLIHRILRSLSSAGVRDVVLNLHHLPHTLTRLLGDGTGSRHARSATRGKCPSSDRPAGPKRAIPLLQPRISESRARSRNPNPVDFLIVNGDTLTDLDLRAVVEDHQRSGALVTMAVVPNTEPDKYGGVVVADDGSVTGFVRRGSREPSCHFVGVQVAEPEAFASVPARRAVRDGGRALPCSPVGTARRDPRVPDERDSWTSARRPTISTRR